jgi:hypothetical protein
MAALGVSPKAAIGNAATINARAILVIFPPPQLKIIGRSSVSAVKSAPGSKGGEKKIRAGRRGA